MLLFICIIVSLLLFCAGFLGLIIRNSNAIIFLICVELILLAANMNFIVFSYYFNDINAKLFVLFAIAAAAAETAVGLALFMKIFKSNGIIYLKNIVKLKG